MTILEWIDFCIWVESQRPTRAAAPPGPAASTAPGPSNPYLRAAFAARPDLRDGWPGTHAEAEALGRDIISRCPRRSAMLPSPRR